MKIKGEMYSSLTQYINDNFGSKRGFVNALKYKALYLLNYYRVYQHIDFNAVNRLVFVCSGNVCRSPFGEYMARDRGLDAVSYGLHCRGGDGADPRAIHEAAIRGVDMKGHVTRNISEYTTQSGDLMLVMEPGHLSQLSAMNVSFDQVTLVPLWSKSPSPFLNDPFTANDVFFNRCEAVVEQCVDKIATRLKVH